MSGTLPSLDSAIGSSPIPSLLADTGLIARYTNNAVLYQSVRVLDGITSHLCLRTIEDRPPLAQLVRRLVLGLPDLEDELLLNTLGVSESLDQLRQGPVSQIDLPIETKDEAVAESFVLIEILTRCSSVNRLQIQGAFHDSLREVVVPVLHSRTYDTLICTPRLHGTPRKWGDGFYRAEDVFALAAQTQAVLEIECMFSCDAGLLPMASRPRQRCCRPRSSFVACVSSATSSQTTFAICSDTRTSFSTLMFTPSSS